MTNAGGTITACEPPRHLAATWEFGGGVSWIDVRLDAVAPERTLLVLERTATVEGDFWNQYGPGAVGVGWDLTLLGLGLHLGGDMSSGRVEGEAWAASDDGKRYQRLASDDWCRASIAFGTDPAQARSAADRTTEFYTGGH